MLAADTDTASDAALLKRTVREAGALALRMFRTDIRQWTKGASSPVSEADIAVDELIRQRLQSATPDYGWLSEESADDRVRLDKRRVWIVDPIDGTRAYLSGREDWSVSAALVEDGTPRLGAVFAPATDEFFFAGEGCGATRNDAAIKVSPGTGFDIDRMAGPHFLLNRVRGATSPELRNFKIGSLALRISRVAEGALDAAFVGGNSRDWDLAAADLLLREAGGRLTTVEGAAPTYNRVEVTHGVLVAAGRERHTELVRHLAQH
ncbi:3'(2'),5'-bisphosphate nucleotidase CysQ [Bradyrhizobium sp. LHD-71]|uniref:3'(2'),5'-bisphosphate nucleotidase CysQ n=1 Tax=Bradyrhizobium sp. LHD-71 TaxID=3072141 RepID=UPI00280FB880|nr:3'(2'),5'-bisphosphate nucleotidase CysQ [Bradyrhizobium sp. LHD-71]MDQ8726804.1 3'(2'),5'-bisphosphate nucleotidase CysQ [Bradyrhizobium sp. LHD-71]